MLNQKVTVMDVVRNPWKIIKHYGGRGYFKWMPDELYIKICYRAAFGNWPDLDNPVTFNEKLNWLKLHDRKPIYSKMVDKYEAKKYVAEILGSECSVPTFGVWDSFNEIDFSKLPNSFVLKCTHDSGAVVICKYKNKFDKLQAKKVIDKSLNREFYYVGREWPYKNVKPRIIAEKMLDDGSGKPLVDYKFFCFDGKAKIMYISRDGAANPTTDFFDMDFNHLPIRMKDPNSDVLPFKPKCFTEMKEIAEKLSQNIPHVRVDFFFVNNKIYVGELTFYHSAGFSHVYPEEWNYKMGDWINININI